MYKLLLNIYILFTSLISVQCLEKCLKEDFENYKLKYDKNYNSSEEGYRFEQYCNNLDYINNFNEKPHNSIVLGMNQFGDLSNNEFRTLNNLVRTSRPKSVNNVKNLTPKSVPESLDWRDMGMVTPVKDQGTCGSCWAFSAIAALESSSAIHGKEHKLHNFSEQELVDCSGDYGNMGCGGGFMDNAFKYLMKYGAEGEKSYPYNGTDGSCNYSKSEVIVNVSRFIDVPKNNEEQLMYAVVGNPVSVGIDAGDPSFQFYKSGIYNISDCGNELDHGVTVVGYGKDIIYKLDYWIVKNSWNSDWGYDGYIYMRRNHEDAEGMCGIAMDPSYPLV